MDSLQDCNYFQLKCSPSWICLVTLSRQLFAKGILCIRDLFHKDHVFFLNNIWYFNKIMESKGKVKISICKSKGKEEIYIVYKIIDFKQVIELIHKQNDQG